MNIKNVYILEDRSILYISGEDAKSFLQNLISNDINKVSEHNSCFTSLLTPQCGVNKDVKQLLCSLTLFMLSLIHI